ncbi:MAG: arginine--tRNA ligase [Deltaproteobacteria bacterium]|nr:arginine--tRNA ligase [Deltaproteobacteria bacterium]
MKAKLEHILRQCLESCFETGGLVRTPIPDFVVEIPNNPEHGQFATNLPMTLASSQKRPPREIAGVIVEALREKHPLLEKVEIAGPGFLNFTIRLEEWNRVLAEIITLGPDYGRSDLGAGERILVEFVSANPTGPLHLGHGRGAALGDSLCRILSFCGFEVAREFYINDAGLQIRLLGESIYSRWRQRRDPAAPFPEGGYMGGYIETLASEIDEIDALDALDPDEAVERCAEFGRQRMLEEIRSDLEAFRTTFDIWVSEKALVASGLLDEVLERTRARGDLYEQDGAWWIKTTLFGDDKDRVIRKNDGQFTYFATDIAYHLDKWKRGFTRAVNIWGADHHGYVQRVKAALMANGLEEDWLSVILIQLVKLWEGGTEIRMSKRAGTYVTLRELMDEVGVDATRFLFLVKNHDSPLDFDLDLARKQDSDNPVYYVQYAHARICSVFRKAAEEGMSLPEEPLEVLGRLELEEERALVRFLARFPSLLADVCGSHEPHRVPYYLTELASAFHKYFNLGTRIPEHRIVTRDAPRTQARLCLAAGIRTVLQNGLLLLGVHAPERM